MKANDLLDISVIGAIVAGYQRPTDLVYYAAREWKGQVPKKVTEHRIKKILDQDELVILNRCLKLLPRGLHHNVYDAVALGAYHLRRKYNG
jgi:hypothetical protein